MISFILRKLVILVPTFFGVTLAAFVFVRMVPGDPVLMMAGERGMTEERHAEMMALYGYDRPVIEQYYIYIKKVLKGDLGKSVVTKRPVLDDFFDLFPATVELSMVALAIAVFIGLPAGMIAAVKRKSIFDHTTMAAALIGYSMPIYWLGLLFIVLFAGILGWTPVSGRISFLFYFEPVTGFMLIDSFLSGQNGAFASAVSHMILPSITLATIPTAIFARQTRSAMLEVLGEDYVRTAKAKGLGPRRVIGLHALRNALIPVVTIIGLQVGVLFAGAMLTETIFAWPGIGKWIYDSLTRRDYPSLQGGILMIASMVVFVNLLVDILYGLINPQIRHTN